jgi:hypothetical protein
MRSTVPIRGCAPISKPARWDMCWPSAATAACPPQPARDGPTPWPPACPRVPGSGSRPVRGLQGQRYYDWAWVSLTAESGHHWLLLRRHPRHGELAFYRCSCPTLVRLGELVGVAGRRWTIEESFQAAKGLAGLDEHQLRRWLPWRRWTLLAMLAHALLAVIAATERAQHPPQPGLIALTCNEIRHLFTSLITEPTRRLTDPLAWSRWRRRHQYHARASHYRRQQAQLT